MDTLSIRHAQQLGAALAPLYAAPDLATLGDRLASALLDLFGADTICFDYFDVRGGMHLALELDQSRQVSADPANRPLLVELGSVVGALPQDVRDQVTSIEAVTPDSIRLKTVSGITIEWGDSSQSELKAQVATALLASGVKTSIDVSAPHAPATR